MIVPWLMTAPSTVKPWPASVRLEPAAKVRLYVVAATSSTGQRPAVGWLGMVTLVLAPGTLLVDQLAGLLHAVDTAPVHATLTASTVSEQFEEQVAPRESVAVTLKLYVPAGVAGRTVP